MKSENSQGIHVLLDKGEYLETRKVKYTKQPNYYRVGNGTTNRQGIESVDLLQAVMDMTKAEQLVVTAIKNNLQWDNKVGEVHIPLSKIFNRTKTVVFHKGFKLLRGKDLVRRTKLSHYMLNPNALIPLDFLEALKLWDESQ